MAYRTFDAGYRTSIALDASNSAWVWGDNSHGQLADGTKTGTSDVPVKVSGHSFVSVAAGLQCLFGLKSDGTLFAWGNNGYGQLGVGDTTDRTTPTAVDVFGVTFSKVSSSRWTANSVAIDSSGNLYAWGNNDAHAVGDGTTTQKTSPVQISTGIVFVDVLATSDRCLALDSSGNVWGWGNNYSGCLGDTNYDLDITTPTILDSANTYAAIGSTDYASYFLKSDGTLYAVGYLSDVFDNSTSPITPIQIANQHTWDCVTGESSVLYLKDDAGTWYGLGEKKYFGINDSGIDSASVPTLVGTTAPDVSVGADFVLSRSDNKIYATGINSYGQLGNGATTAQYVFVPVSNPFSYVPALPLLKSNGLGYPLLPGTLPPLYAQASGGNTTVLGNGGVSLGCLTSSGTGYRAISMEADLPALTGDSTASIGVKGGGVFPQFTSTGTGANFVATAFPAVEGSSLAFSGRALFGDATLPSFMSDSRCGSLGRADLPSLTCSSTCMTERNLTANGLFPSLSGNATAITGRVVSGAAFIPSLTGEATTTTGCVVGGVGVLPSVTGSAETLVGRVVSMTASLPSLSGASSGHFDIVIAHNAELPSFEGASYITTSRFASTILRYTRPT